MGIESSLEVIEASSLEDYILAVDPSLAENNYHLVFFDYSLEALKDEIPIVRHSTMFNILINFRDYKLYERKVDYSIFLNESISKLSYTVLQEVNKGMDLILELSNIASSNPRNMTLDAMDLGRKADECASIFRRVEVASYALAGYKTIRDHMNGKSE